jgi:hypothetical protein
MIGSAHKGIAKPELTDGMAKVLEMEHTQIGGALRNLNFFLTARGLFGAALVSPSGCHVHARVVFLDCYKVPFLLREASDYEAQILISPCYIGGLMKLTLENRRKVGGRAKVMLI